ncbi:MAG: DUF2190 family protein [Victivallales bacterium]|nr:DUF2190 family protein [Victivallales bacterium]
MATYIGTPEVVTITAAKDLDAGEPVQIAANFYGIPHCPVASGSLAAVQIEGIYGFTATANVSAGATVYLSSGNVNTTSAAGTAIGKAVETVTSGAVVKVLLNR